MRRRNEMWAAALLATTVCVSWAPGAGTPSLVETFDDDVLLPTLGRTADPGWTNVVDDGELAMAKEEGIPGFSAARLSFCETLAGDFTASVHARKGASIGSLGIVVSQLEDGWVGFSDIFFNGPNINALCGTADPSSAVVSADGATEAIFQITRVGTTITLSYDIGEGFVELLSRTDELFAGPMLLGCFHLEQGAETDARSGWFDDLEIEAADFGEQGADLNWDGTVDFEDLLRLLGAWGPCPAESCCAEDLDRNGSVEVADILALLGLWE